MFGRREILRLAPGRATDRGEYWLHVSRTAMACRFEVTFPDSVESGVREAGTALDEAERLEGLLSVYRSGSEVSRINRGAGAIVTGVDPGLIELLERCRRLSELTGGAFDITAGPLSRVWGFTRREGRVPTAAEIGAAREMVGSAMVLTDRAARTVCLARSGMEINLGGVGKGYALDQMAARLRAARVPALLTAGFSSMLALGQIWTVGLGDPRRPGRRLAVVRMRDLALGTSGSEEQYFEEGGVRYGHVIDPRSGQPAPAGASVTVIAPLATDADALATGLYVGGRRLAEDFCGANPGTVVVLLEAGADRPLVIGSNPQCEVRFTDERE